MIWVLETEVLSRIDDVAGRMVLGRSVSLMQIGIRLQEELIRKDFVRLNFTAAMCHLTMLLSMSP